MVATNDKVSILEEIKSLLKTFQDFIPEEILTGLPLMRDIQHVIDFIPRSIIANKSAYRMNPQEHNKLQHQVRELLEKGLVRESISPCVILTLLVPKKDRTWKMSI